MRTLKIFFAFPLFLLLSCDDSTLPIDNPTLLNGCEEIIITNDSDVFPEDPLFIEKAVINSDTLKITVQYGGGCGDVDFKLIGDGAFMESNPVQSNITLSLKDEDPCKANVSKELCYDLVPLATLYKNMYQASSGTIILRIKGFETPVQYSF